jgi:hypothetical protein
MYRMMKGRLHGAAWLCMLFAILFHVDGYPCQYGCEGPSESMGKRCTNLQEFFYSSMGCLTDVRRNNTLLFSAALCTLLCVVQMVFDMMPQREVMQEQRNKALRRLKGPLKPPHGAEDKHSSGVTARSQSSCSKPASTDHTGGSQKGVSLQVDPEQQPGDSTEATQVHQARLERKSAVAKRTRFESNRANLGNFERAYPVEVETVNIIDHPCKVWRFCCASAHFIAWYSSFCRH